MSQKKSGQPPSQARLTANRANAQKSTGPKSPEGKARSSMNAWKHGITARSAALTRESDEDFERLALDYRTRFQPVDGFEVALLDQIIQVHWHMDRVRWIQSAHLELELRREHLTLGYNPEALPNGFFVALAYKALGDNSRIIDLTNRELARLSREYARLNQVFLDIRRECPPIAPHEASSPASPYQPGSPASPETPAQNEPTPSPRPPAAGRALAAPIFFKPQPVIAPEAAPPPLAFAAA
jgi:hypothetical protein